MQRLYCVVGHVVGRPVTASDNDAERCISRNVSVSTSTVVASQYAPKANHPVVVTIIASGNSGHVCVSLFEGNAKGRVQTQLLTGRPDVWENVRPKVRLPNGGWQQGYIHKVSADPAELIPHSDIVLWTGPLTSSKQVFEQLHPYLDTKKTVLGTIFAQGLTHLLATRIFGPSIRFFALRNIPWLCRTLKPGLECEIVGAKSSIGVSAISLNEQWIKSHVEPLFMVENGGKREPVMEMAPDFCPVVFNPANQIIHPARYWGLFRSWQGKPLRGQQEPNEWLYRDMDEVSGMVLEVLDEELQALKDAFFAATGAEGCKLVIPLRDRLMQQYGEQIEDTSTMAKLVGTNGAYRMARTPVIRTDAGVMPNPTHRVVTDDIGFGLCVLLSIAERLEAAGFPTPTTMMRMAVDWHQRLMGKEFLVGGRLLGCDCAELVLLRPEDPLELVANVPAHCRVVMDGRDLAGHSAGF